MLTSLEAATYISIPTHEPKNITDIIENCLLIVFCLCSYLAKLQVSKSKKKQCALAHIVLKACPAKIFKIPEFNFESRQF